jgi:cell division protein FtsL
MPPHARHGKIDPATRSFQGLRIYVNEELSEIEVFLKKSIDLLREGSRLVIVSFHSLEDRLVKHFFKENAVKRDLTPHLPWHSHEGPEHVFTLLTKKSVTPSEEELSANPRSRSARLRVMQKVTMMGIGLALVLGAITYGAKQQVMLLEDKLSSIERSLIVQKENHHLLRAEWAHLSNPMRIQALAKEHLGMIPMEGWQLVACADIEQLFEGGQALPETAMRYASAQDVKAR